MRSDGDGIRERKITAGKRGIRQKKKIISDLLSKVANVTEWGKAEQSKSFFTKIFSCLVWE